jgi:hypothetical protein
MFSHARFPSFLAVAALFGLAQAIGCGTQDDQSQSAESASDLAAMAACHFTHNDVGPGGHMHACNPTDTKKTTICHIPPGNPANAHTICVGNAAVPAHIQNHGDSVGMCVNETPCTGSGGAGGGAGAGAGGAAGAGDGSGGAAGAGDGSGGAAGAGTGGAAGAGTGGAIVP